MATNIVIADAAPTPVNHTFVPAGYDLNNVYSWQDQSFASALGYWGLMLSLRRPPLPSARQSSDDRNFRTKLITSMPILANVSNSTISGVLPNPILAYTMRAYTEFVLPEACTALDRANLSKMHALALQNAQIRAVSENLFNPGS